MSDNKGQPKGSLVDSLRLPIRVDTSNVFMSVVVMVLLIEFKKLVYGTESVLRR